MNELEALAEHTPGPWKSCNNGDCPCGQVWSLPVDQPVATANTTWGDDPESIYGEIPADQMHANARLIAAAPELLTAAEGLLKAIREMSDVMKIDFDVEAASNPDSPVAKAIAAIAKARALAPAIPV